MKLAAIGELNAGADATVGLGRRIVELGSEVTVDNLEDSDEVLFAQRRGRQKTRRTRRDFLEAAIGHETMEVNEQAQV